MFLYGLLINHLCVCVAAKVLSPKQLRVQLTTSVRVWAECSCLTTGKQHKKTWNVDTWHVDATVDFLRNHHLPLFPDILQ